MDLGKCGLQIYSLHSSRHISIDNVHQHRDDLRSVRTSGVGILARNSLSFSSYEAICCPFRSCTALRRVRRVIVICWLSSLIAATPQIFIFEQSLIPGEGAKYRCASTGYTAEWQRRVYFTAFASYVLIIPAVCMTICYVKIVRTVACSTKVWIQKIRGQTTTTFLSFPASSPAKIKTVKLAMTIIMVFIVCWTPYMLITLMEVYSNRHLRLPSWLDGVLQTICFAQSSANPFIYIIFNHRRKESPTIILAAARMGSKKHHQRRRTNGSTSSTSVVETSFQSDGYFRMSINANKRANRTDSLLLP